MGRPIIGITGELEAARWGNWIREAVVSPLGYTRAVERAGGTPVLLPPVPMHSVPGLLAALDGLVLAGGRDVDPALYGEDAHAQTDPPDHRRDRFELALIRAAIDAGLPFLAICRGMHVLNVARGGTLIQHLPDRLGNESHKPDPVKLTAHEVQISAGCQVGLALGAGTARVPAGHHQAIDRMSRGLLTVAWTSDRVAEAVELEGHGFGVGVQWHPEESDDLKLFEALVAATAKAPAATPPAEAAVVSTAPASTAPASTAPASTAPASTAPASTAPASTAPASTAPASTAPASTAPASTAPVNAAPSSKKRHKRSAARS